MAFPAEVYSARLPDDTPLMLRPPTYDELNALMPTPGSVWEYVGDSDPAVFLREDTAGNLMDSLESPHLRSWGIEAYGRIVGVTGIIQWDVPYPGGFTFIMDPAVWQKGVGSTARTIASKDVFDREEDCRAVGAYAHIQNRASQRMLQGIGFQTLLRGREWDYFVLPRLDGTGPPGLPPDQLEDGRRKFAAKIAASVIRRV